MDSIDYSQSKTDNLTIGERKALSALMKRTDIVINKADKGSTIVVLDRDQYIKDGLHGLGESKSAWYSLYHQQAIPVCNSRLVQFKIFFLCGCNRARGEQS